MITTPSQAARTGITKHATPARLHGASLRGVKDYYPITPRHFLLLRPHAASGDSMNFN